MAAKTLVLTQRVSTPFRLNTRKIILTIAVAAVVASAAWGFSLWNTAATPTTATALEPGIKLAVGTVSLEGTGQAVDAKSAAALLPLWELLQDLDTSGTAAPQEITAVIDEIRLNMTSAQIQAIDAMKIDAGQQGIPAASKASSASSSTSSSQASAVANDPALGGDMSGAPMDGGGPMPGSSSQSTTSGSKASSTTPSPAAIRQVIQLLKSKVQG